MKMEKNKSPRACIVVTETPSPPFMDLLGSFQIVPEIFLSSDKALVRQKQRPFDILIVQDDPSEGQGLKLIEEFLKTNWMTSTIIICDQDEATIHDRAEGLGILGHVRQLDDLQSFENLFRKFKQISPMFGD